MINKHVKYAIEFQADASVQPVITHKCGRAHIPVVAPDIAAPGAYFLGAPNEKSGNLAGTQLGLYAKKNWACNPDLVICSTRRSPAPSRRCASTASSTAC